MHVGSEGADPQGRYADCCVLLLQGGAEVETADTTYGRTAAHWAVYYQREDILTVLLEAGKVNTSNNTKELFYSLSSTIIGS